MSTGTQPESPWRSPDFRRLFGATALSQLATSIGYVGVPLIAVTTLDASPGQVGTLAALSTAAFLLIGLPAGAWVDRFSHRRLLIGADLGRAVLFAAIPLGRQLHSLNLWELYLIVLLNGCATVFFDIGSQSVLPNLIPREGLVQANGVVVSLIAAGNIAGRGAGGALVQLLSAPVATVFSAVGYLLSALRLTGIGRGATSVVAAVPASGPRASLRAQIGEGVRHVLGNPELRAFALTASLSNLGSQIVNTLLPLLFVRELRLPAGALGLFWSVGGAGLLLGARCARPVAARLGYGRTLGLAGLCLAPAGLLVPLAGRGPWLWIAGAGWLLVMFKIGMDNVLGVSIRQRMTPDPLLGRMNATFRFLLTGALTVGSALAGLIGGLVGLHFALWAGGAFLSCAFLPVFLSPVRRRHVLPGQEVKPGCSGPAGPGTRTSPWTRPRERSGSAGDGAS